MGVDRVGLPLQPAGLPVLPGDLDDRQTFAGQGPGNPGAIRAGALDSDPLQWAVFAQERHDPLIPLDCGRELAVRDAATEMVEHGDVMGVLVSVDPRHQQWWRVGRCPG